MDFSWRKDSNLSLGCLESRVWHFQPSLLTIKSHIKAVLEESTINIKHPVEKADPEIQISKKCMSHIFTNLHASTLVFVAFRHSFVFSYFTVTAFAKE